MKLTEVCPLKYVLFGRPESEHKLPAACGKDPEIECCVYQFLVFLFYRCKNPQEMLDNLAQIVKSERSFNSH